MLQTVVETPEYIKQANSCMDNTSRESFINYIAEHPLDGDLIQKQVALAKYDGLAIVIKVKT